METHTIPAPVGSQHSYAIPRVKTEEDEFLLAVPPDLNLPTSLHGSSSLPEQAVQAPPPIWDTETETSIGGLHKHEEDELVAEYEWDLNGTTVRLKESFYETAGLMFRDKKHWLRFEWDAFDQAGNNRTDEIEILDKMLFYEDKEMVKGVGPFLEIQNNPTTDSSKRSFSVLVKQLSRTHMGQKFRIRMSICVGGHKALEVWSRAFTVLSKPRHSRDSTDRAKRKEEETRLQKENEELRKKNKALEKHITGQNEQIKMLQEKLAQVEKEELWKKQQELENQLLQQNEQIKVLHAAMQASRLGPNFLESVKQEEQQDNSYNNGGEEEQQEGDFNFDAGQVDHDLDAIDWDSLVGALDKVDFVG